MKQLKEYININESNKLNNKDLQNIVMGVTKKIFPENGAFTFRINLKIISAISNLDVNVDDILNNCINHIVEGTIKSAFPNKLVTTLENKEKINIIKQYSDTSYDISINELKVAFKAITNNNISNMVITKEEYSNVDYIMIINYKYVNKIVTIKDMYLTSKFGSNPIGKQINKKQNTSTLNFEEV